MIEDHVYASHKPRGRLIGHNRVVWVTHLSCKGLVWVLGLVVVVVSFVWLCAAVHECAAAHACVVVHSCAARMI